MGLTINIGREVLIVLLLLAMWGGSIYYFFIAWREAKTTLQLERYGATSPGKITSWNVPMRRRAGKLRKVAFAYKVDGTTYMGHQILWKTQLETIEHQGQQVEIRYFVSNPYRARLNALFTKAPMVAQHRFNATLLLLFSCPLFFLSLAFFHWMPRDIAIVLSLTSGFAVISLILVLYFIAKHMVKRKRLRSEKVG